MKLMITPVVRVAAGDRQREYVQKTEAKIIAAQDAMSLHTLQF